MSFIENLDEMIANIASEEEFDMYINDITDRYEFYWEDLCMLEVAFNEKEVEFITHHKHVDEIEDYEEKIGKIENKLEKLHVKIFGA